MLSAGTTSTAADAPALLERELTRPGYRCRPIHVGGVTDVYQPAERELRITRGVLEVLVGLWRRCRGFPAVGVQGGVAGVADARPIAMILEMDFPDQAALDACLASPIRPESHAATVAVMEMFEGRFYHLVSEGRTLPPAG